MLPIKITTIPLDKNTLGSRPYNHEFDTAYYSEYIKIRVKASVTNSTANATFNTNGLGLLNLLKNVKLKLRQIGAYVNVELASIEPEIYQKCYEIKDKKLEKVHDTADGTKMWKDTFLLYGRIKENPFAAAYGNPPAEYSIGFNTKSMDEVFTGTGVTVNNVSVELEYMPIEDFEIFAGSKNCLILKHSYRQVEMLNGANSFDKLPKEAYSKLFLEVSNSSGNLDDTVINNMKIRIDDKIDVVTELGYNSNKNELALNYENVNMADIPVGFNIMDFDFRLEGDMLDLSEAKKVSFVFDTNDTGVLQLLSVTTEMLLLEGLEETRA